MWVSEALPHKSLAAKGLKTRPETVSPLRCLVFISWKCLPDESSDVLGLSEKLAYASEQCRVRDTILDKYLQMHPRTWLVFQEESPLL